MTRLAIDDLDDPRLDPYRNLTRKNLTRRSGLFIVEGRLLVERLIDSDFQVASILVAAHREEEMQRVLHPEHQVLVIPREMVESLVGFDFHSGVLACGVRRPPPDLDQLLKVADAPWTMVACPYIEDPENMGQIVRTAAAFGATALLLDPRCADPFSRRALRVSMGNAFRLPIFQSSELRPLLAELRDGWQFQLAAAVLGEKAIPLFRAKRGEGLVILLGNEATGLDDSWRSFCDFEVTIPMQPGVDSLNVAASAAVLLYHFCQSNSVERS